MDKLTKYLKRLARNDLRTVELTIDLLVRGKLKNLNIKKLRGHKDVYRVRVGSTRIIYREQNGKIKLLDISKRDESTYRKY